MAMHSSVQNIAPAKILSPHVYVDETSQSSRFDRIRAMLMAFFVNRVDSGHNEPRKLL
jgi:hypothetical protein